MNTLTRKHQIPGVPKNVPHLNLEYLKNYARDVHDFGVIRKCISWKFLCFDEHIPCHEATIGIKQGKVIVQNYFKFGSNILTKRQFRNQSPGNALGRGYGALEMCFNLLTR